MYFRCKIIFLSFLCSLFLVASFSLRAADAIPAATSEQWQQLTKDFGYKNEVEQQVKTDTKPNWLEQAIMKIINLVGATGFKIILWTIIGTIAVYIIYKLVLGSEHLLFGRRNKKQVNENGDELGELNGANDWDALLQKAVSNNDLPLAVRYSYMWLLQLLENKSLINYREDKTNFEYYRELENTAFKQPFRQISRKYEYVNYGKYQITPNEYNEYITLFNNVKKQLGR